MECPKNEKPGFARLAPYQTVLYCDDSGLMAAGDLVNTQKALVERIASVATRPVPDATGAHLRFINKSETGLDNLSLDQIMLKLHFSASGSARIGTMLNKKILEPFIYDPLDRGDSLPRPFIIAIITHGFSDGEPVDTFKNAILECGKRLTKRGYPPEHVMFLVCHIGKSFSSENFLDSLTGDPGLQHVLYLTTERGDEKYTELRKNEEKIQQWLVGVLIQPICSWLGGVSQYVAGYAESANM